MAQTTNTTTKKPKVAAVVTHRTRQTTSGFMNFVREQGVVGLAVGLAIGASAGAAVKAIVDGFISPIVGFILGGVDLSSLTLHTGLWRADNELVIAWGAVANAMIVLLATALVVYLLIHGFKLDKLDKKKD